MVFVHGYNTGFDNAVYRVTQIAHDSGYSGTPVLFSWASGGKTTDYVYDKESASVARDQLEATLRLLAQSGARRIDIVAHSMGTWVTMEALRQLAITGDRDLGGKLGDVVLASPDIDVDVFKSQMRRYGKPTKPLLRHALLSVAATTGAATCRRPCDRRHSDSPASRLGTPASATAWRATAARSRQCTRASRPSSPCSRTESRLADMAFNHTRSSPTTRDRVQLTRRASAALPARTRPAAQAEDDRSYRRTARRDALHRPALRSTIEATC